MILIGTTIKDIQCHIDKNHIDIAIQLILAGADHTALNSRGKSPLEYVRNSDDLETLHSAINYRNSWAGWLKSFF